MKQHECISRRGALGMCATAVMSWTTSNKVSAAEQKLAKSAVQYTDAGTVKGADCDDCTQFIAGKTLQGLGTCKVVDGDINPHGHCLAFSPKPKQ